MELRRILYIIFLVVIIGGMVILITYTIYQNEKLCREAGYDTSGSEATETGYISCCNRVYENHIRLDDVCEGIKS